MRALAASSWVAITSCAASTLGKNMAAASSSSVRIHFIRHLRLGREGGLRWETRTEPVVRAASVPAGRGVVPARATGCEATSSILACPGGTKSAASRQKDSAPGSAGGAAIRSAVRHLLTAERRALVRDPLTIEAIDRVVKVRGRVPRARLRRRFAREGARDLPVVGAGVPEDPVLQPQGVHRADLRPGLLGAVREAAVVPGGGKGLQPGDHPRRL